MVQTGHFELIIVGVFDYIWVLEVFNNTVRDCFTLGQIDDMDRAKIISIGEQEDFKSWCIAIPPYPSFPDILVAKCFDIYAEMPHVAPPFFR